MSAAVELRDHRGRLVEARDEAGRLIYSDRSNYGRLWTAMLGRPEVRRLRPSIVGGIYGRAAITGHVRVVERLS